MRGSRIRTRFLSGPISDVRYSYDEWSNIRSIQAAYTQTWAEGPRASDSWYEYDDAGRMTISNGTMSDGVIRLKLDAWQCPHRLRQRRSQERND